MTDTLSELSAKLASDPDAQATVTDFLDYTEFFPSDLFRSLTFIGKLDEMYQQDTAKLHQFTKTYGELPTLPAPDRPEPQKIRQDISSALDHAIRCRESTFAEATRLCSVADNLYHRVVGIKKKLEVMPKPPSRDPTPAPPTLSPVAIRGRKLEERTPPQINLSTASNREETSARTEVNAARRHRIRKIIVPGEVLPPFDANSPGEFESDSESERPSSPVAPQIRIPDRFFQEKALKAPKPAAIKLPKAIPTRIRPPGVMGTNVHSTVAGISVSNAMALIEAPPPNPQPGSKHAPWLKLTEWELNKLRKRMKKNADWVPSDTMVRRELAENGRGHENLMKAKIAAEKSGVEMLDEEPEAFVRPVTYRSLSTNLAPNVDLTDSLENRGMKLNQAKKLKRDTMLKDQITREQAFPKGQAVKPAIANVLEANDIPRAEPATSQSLSALDTSKDTKPVKKRKRESSQDAPRPMIDPALFEAPKPAPKKLKLTPSTSGGGNATSTTDPAKTTPKLALPALPMTDLSSEGMKAPRTTTRNNRASAADNISTANSVASEITQPRSRNSTIISLTLANKKAASAEPPVRRTSDRRTSNASLPSTTAGTPIAKRTAPAIPNRHGKRPAPGVLTSHEGVGGLQVIIGKRKAAPGQRIFLAGINNKKSKAETTPLTLAEEEAIDPDEPRYCLCGDVSYGKMVACENECEREWFHLGCVGLVEEPPRRAKWYCPECRVKLKVTEQGEPLGRHGSRR